MLNFYTLLIGAEGAKTPVGVWFRGDPAGAFLRVGSPKHPRTARSWSGNQQARLPEPKIKQRQLHEGRLTFFYYIYFPFINAHIS
ncbi:hypothetical protein QE429_001603 [Bacillus sp. SORGH_AS 510]|nr:hypothetical protein [Bacillus sp. SORGH_AS_0510]